MSVPELRGYSRRPDEGEDVWVAGALYTFKALGSENGNAYTLVEIYGRGGLATPHHLHEREEEGFYVVDGEVTLNIGEDSIKAAPGTFAFVPRGVPHGFRFDSAEAKLLLLLTPGAAGHEGLFREIGEPATRHAIPAPISTAPDVARLAEIAAKHGTTIVGPPHAE